MTEREGKKLLGELVSEGGLLVRVYAPDPPPPDEEVERREKAMAAILAKGIVRAARHAAKPTPTSSNEHADGDTAAAGCRRVRWRLLDAREALALARAWRTEIDESGINKAEIARREGFSRARVTQVMRLLDLPPDVQQALVAGEIAWSVRRALREVDASHPMRRTSSR